MNSIQATLKLRLGSNDRLLPFRVSCSLRKNLVIPTLFLRFAFRKDGFQNWGIYVILTMCNFKFAHVHWWTPLKSITTVTSKKHLTHLFFSPESKQIILTIQTLIKMATIDVSSMLWGSHWRETNGLWASTIIREEHGHTCITIYCFRSWKSRHRKQITLTSIKKPWTTLLDNMMTCRHTIRTWARHCALICHAWDIMSSIPKEENNQGITT